MARKRGVKTRRKSAASRKRTGKKRWLTVRKRKRTNAAKRSRKAVSTPRPSAKLSQAIRAAVRKSSGMKGLRRYRKFWQTPVPVSMKMFDDSAVKNLRLGALVSMGKSDRVVLKLNGKTKVTTLRGKWEPYTDAAGKRILILSGRKIRGPLKAIGVAPETWYMASPRLEAAGTHKAKVLWRHKHTDDGGRPPLVYADRNGKVDKNSNFIYARGTYTVTDWIRR